MKGTKEKGMEGTRRGSATPGKKFENWAGEFSAEMVRNGGERVRHYTHDMSKSSCHRVLSA